MDAATPLWVVVLVAAIGVLGTLLAALIAQAVTSRREAGRAREQVDREVGQARDEVARVVEQAREDMARQEERSRRQAADTEQSRLLAEKRAAYVELLVSASRWERYIAHKRDQREARNGMAVPIDAGPFADAVDRAYAAVQILGDPSVLEPAGKAYHNLLITVVHLEASHFSVQRVDEGLDLASQHLQAFLGAVRQELDIDPETPLTS